MQDNKFGIRTGKFAPLQVLLSNTSTAIPFDASATLTSKNNSVLPSVPHRTFGPEPVTNTAPETELLGAVAKFCGMTKLP